MLVPHSLDPVDFGWVLDEADGYKPITTLDEIAPEKLRGFVACGCKIACDTNRCSCYKNTLNCVSACAVCEVRFNYIFCFSIEPF